LLWQAFPLCPVGRHACARVCLFAFPPPLLGVELGCERGSYSFFVCTFASLVPSN
jgi:hypothetical protein